MKYVVDEIIDDIAILENIETKEKKEINISNLPDNIKEKNVVVENISYEYILDKEEELDREKTIQDKLDKLKKLKKN